MITINNYIHIQIKQIFIDKYIKQICNKNVQNMAEQKPFIKIYHRYVHNKKNGFDMFHYCLENKANSHRRPSEKSYIQKTEMQKKKETKKWYYLSYILTNIPSTWLRKRICSQYSLGGFWPSKNVNA